MHGREELPVIIGEFSGDVLGAHLFQDVCGPCLGTLLLLQGRLPDRKERFKTGDLLEA